MEQFFKLPVNYQNKTLFLKARMVSFAYSYKFYITINDTEFIFERDDDRQFRMMAGDQEQDKPLPVINPALIDAIIEGLEQIQSA